MNLKSSIRSAALMLSLVSSSVAFGAGPTQANFPNLPPSAADCLPGRHWELVPLARCVCNGDTTRKPVSNDDPSACVGVPPVIEVSTENQTRACPAPQVGTISESRQVTTTNGVISYGAWTLTGSTCTDPTGSSTIITIENQTSACPAPQVGTISESRQVTTTNGVISYGAWTVTGNTCIDPTGSSTGIATITTGTQRQTLPCSIGYTGSGIVQSRSVTYTNGVASEYGEWNTVDSDCSPTQPQRVWSNYRLACFIKGTPVLMADGTEKPIETVAIGDIVKTYDESKHTFTASPVTKALHHAKKMDTLVEFSLTNDKVLTSNSVHLILVNGAYTAAGDIAKQFISGADLNLTGPSGEVVKISTIKVHKKEVELFNLHVKSQYDGPKAESTIGHNYVAGGIVVHNEKAESTLENWPGDDGICSSRGGSVEYYYTFPRSIWCMF